MKNLTMERRVLGNSHARCEAGEKAEIISNPYLSLYIESNVRPFVILYVKHKYGEDSVCGIMAKQTMASKSALLNAARVYGLNKAGDSTAYLNTKAALTDAFAALDPDGNATVSSLKGKLETQFAGNRTALEILHYASLIEGAVHQISQHAAGIIITDGRPVDDYVPLIYSVGNDIMMTQCDMVEAEEAGLLKIDFLGLNNLTVITGTVREIYKRRGIAVDMDRIPYDDREVFEKIYAVGMTNSIFQFESDGMKQMLRQFKPEDIFDLTLLVAMYRPGPLQFLNDVISVKNGSRQRQYLTPQLEPILGNTYCSIVYQEQVQEIFRKLAGYSLGQADLVRRAMSKKKEKVLLAEREAFLKGDVSRGIAGCLANGISEAVADKLFDEMTEFAKYAFNKSHAACYAVVSYQTAWLKCHYPLEYMTAVLNNVKPDERADKVPALVGDLRSMGIEIAAPDINSSQLGFSIQDGRVMFGLGSIKGLGNSVAPVITERESQGSYRSPQDFAVRTMSGASLMEKLVWAGAFDAFDPNRASLADAVPEWAKLADKLKKTAKQIAESYDLKTKEKLEEKLETQKKKLLETAPSDEVCENRLQALLKEKELLGAYASGHPMDLYPRAAAYGATPIGMLQQNKALKNLTVTGIITGLEVKKRKKDGAEFATFTLEDRTGTVEAACFTKNYGRLSRFIQEDAVVKAACSILPGEEDGRLKIAIDNAEPILPVKKTIVIYVPGVHVLSELWKKVLPFVSKNGNPSVVYDLGMDEFRRCDLMLSPAILKADGITAKMMDL